MKFILLPLLLLSLPAHAEQTGWLSFRYYCEAESKPAWLAQAQLGKQWEADSLDNLRRLGEMTEKICPAYFQRPNDSDAIRIFETSKAAILGRSPVVEQQGNSLLAFLAQGLAENQAIFESVEIDFSATPCAAHMRATQKRMNERLAEIRGRVNQLAKSCFGVTAAEAAQHLAKKAPPKKVGQGAPTKIMDGKGKAQSSDITGVKEDRAKRAAPQPK